MLSRQIRAVTVFFLFLFFMTGVHGENTFENERTNYLILKRMYVKWDSGLFAEKGSDYIKEVERNKYLFFLSGRIEKYRIVETGYGREIHLYLYSVKITESLE